MDGVAGMITDAVQDRVNESIEENKQLDREPMIKGRTLVWVRDDEGDVDL